MNMMWQYGMDICASGPHPFDFLMNVEMKGVPLQKFDWYMISVENAVTGNVPECKATLI